MSIRKIQRNGQKTQQKQIPPPNEVMFIRYLKERDLKSINRDWVIWAFSMLFESNKARKVCSEEFIKSLNKPEPEMEPPTETPTPAPA